MTIEMRKPADLKGRKVLLLGLGVNQGGLGVARFLVEHGAEVRVTDLQSAETLAGPLSELEGLPIAYTLGRHDEADIEWAEIVVRNPAVPRESKWLELARRTDAQVEMEMTLFFRLCPAPIIGVTGTKGKTTTTAILGTILHQRWPQAVLAGNMGRTALGQLARVQPDVPVALELSSFQLEALDEQQLGPQVAVLTNVSEDHLDRYATLGEYADVKASIGRHQGPEDWLVSARDDALVGQLLQDAPGRKATFGADPVLDDHALWIDQGRFAGRWDGQPVDLGPIGNLGFPGAHNRMNALAAAAAALAAGVSRDEVAAGIAAATPVANRLEPVAVVNGVEYVNDTTATTPAATVAALQAFAGRELVLIAGGSSKRVALEPLAGAIAQHTSRVVLLNGAATPELAALLAERGVSGVEGPFDSMEDAVTRAGEIAAEGSVVLLSPGCASFGMFRNEFHRGDAFRQAVQTLGGGDA